MAQAFGAAMDTGALPYCAIIMIPTPGARGIWVSVRVWGWIVIFSLTALYQMGIASATQIQAPISHIAGRLEHIMA
jgi:hypothetical protein